MTSLPVWATHEVDHRFVVSGAVRAPDGTPRSDVKVVVTHPRSKLTETVLTDRSGRYSALMHLHDQDAGDPITVTVGEETKTTRAAFDPKDHQTPRSAEVNFGEEAVPSEAPSSRVWAYGVLAAVVVGGLSYYLRLRSRGSRGARQAGRGARKPKSRR